MPDPVLSIKNLVVEFKTDDGIVLWDVLLREKRCKLTGHAGHILSLAFSSDGKTLASGAMDKTVRVWNLATLKDEKRFVHDQPVSSVVFAPDGKTLASTCDDKTISRLPSAPRLNVRSSSGP